MRGSHFDHSTTGAGAPAYAKIVHPAAWRPNDFASEADFTFELNQAHLAVLAESVGPDQAQPLLEMPPSPQARTAVLHEALTQVRRELVSGRGLVLMRGFPVHDFDPSVIEQMYWAVGAHLGRGVSQSTRGDYMGYVRDETKAGEPESARGYLSRRRLGLHTDLAELVGLLCVRPAKSGGTSLIASACAMYNVIVAEHPEYLPVFHRGFPYHRRGEQAPDVEPVTPYDVPIFSTAEGMFSCFYVRGILDATFRETGREPSAFEREALDYFDALSLRADICLEIDLQAGDCLLLNNCTTLHARREFVDFDEPARKRLYYRLWLEGYERRPLVPEFFIYQNASGRMGIDAQAGQEPAESKFLASPYAV